MCDLHISLPENQGHNHIQQLCFPRTTLSPRADLCLGDASIQRPYMDPWIPREAQKIKVTSRGGSVTPVTHLCSVNCI